MRRDTLEAETRPCQQGREAGAGVVAHEQHQSQCACHEQQQQQQTHAHMDGHLETRITAGGSTGAASEQLAPQGGSAQQQEQQQEPPAEEGPGEGQQRELVCQGSQSPAPDPSVHEEQQMHEGGLPSSRPVPVSLSDLGVVSQSQRRGTFPSPLYRSPLHHTTLSLKVGCSKCCAGVCCGCLLLLWRLPLLTNHC
jgi:hypothetical protein